MLTRPRQFLEYQAKGAIAPPFIMDVFALDTMTEMLASPLLLLSSINRRTAYDDKVMASHELVVLSYHLRANLWLGAYDYMSLDDDISADLDVAMTVSRDKSLASGRPKAS